MTHEQTHTKRVPWLFVFVPLVGASVALLWGSQAVQLYLPFGIKNEALASALSNVGLWWGAATGILAGIIWIAVMSAVVSRVGTARLGRIGSLVGMAVGSLSTLLLHIGLARVSGGGGVGMVREGLLFGIPSGLIAGAVCGCMYRDALLQRVRIGAACPGEAADVESAREHLDD